MRAASYERLVASAVMGGAFMNRVTRLSALAHGRPAALVAELREAAEASPYDVLRFTKLLVEPLEGDDAEVRGAQASLVRALAVVLDEVRTRHATVKTHVRLADELAGRVQALAEVTGSVGSATVESQARTLAQRSERFAGHLRLAPSDPLPWPFQAPQPQAPSVFTPLKLTPVEWRAPGDEPTFGWSISE